MPPSLKKNTSQAAKNTTPRRPRPTRDDWRRNKSHALAPARPLPKTPGLWTPALYRSKPPPHRKEIEHDQIHRLLIIK